MNFRHIFYNKVHYILLNTTVLFIQWQPDFMCHAWVENPTITVILLPQFFAFPTEDGRTLVS